MVLIADMKMTWRQMSRCVTIVWPVAFVIISVNTRNQARHLLSQVREFQIA